LLFLFFAQDIAHVTERNLSASSMSRFSYLVGRFSGVHAWPVLGVPRGLKLVVRVAKVVEPRTTIQVIKADPGDRNRAADRFSEDVGMKQGTELIHGVLTSAARLLGASSR